MSLALKKAVQREVRDAGRAGLVDPGAFNEIVAYVGDTGGDLEVVHAVLKHAASGKAFTTQTFRQRWSALWLTMCAAGAV